MAYKGRRLDFESISSKAFLAILLLDRGFIGSENYMGLAYFWAHEYRHFLRDCTIKSRKAVHDAFLRRGMDLCGVSAEHEELVKRLAKGYAR